MQSVFSFLSLVENALEADLALSYHRHFQEGKSGPFSSWGTEMGKEVRNMDKEQG